MKFEKTTEHIPIAYGLYHISYDYLNHLKRADNNVIDPDENDLYCGPVYHAVADGKICGFFVPVDINTFECYDVFPMYLFCSKLGGDLLDFGKMIPLANPNLVTPVTDEKCLSEYLVTIKDRIEECANYVLGVTNGIIKPDEININARYQRKAASEIKIVRINKSYLESLRYSDYKTADSEHMLYCGPVILADKDEMNSEPLYIPIIENIAKLDGTIDMQTCLHNRELGELDFRHMIPCPEKEMEIVNDEKRHGYYNAHRKGIEIIAKRCINNT